MLTFETGHKKLFFCYSVGFAGVVYFSEWLNFMSNLLKQDYDSKSLRVELHMTHASEISQSLD